VTARFDDATAMDPRTFQQRVVETYHTVLEELRAGGRYHPVRFWNFVPGINDDLGAGLDRYMAFNAGRYAAFMAHFGHPTIFNRSLPTASGVGVHGDQFVLHGLAADEPGVPIDNPRQVPAYLYSRRFGPMPPCFARATLLGAHTAEPLLIVGGTASILGEQSQHIGQLEQQALETFRNLASVVASADGLTRAADSEDADLEPLLSTFRDVRIYHRRAGDRPVIAALVRDRFHSSCRVELAEASLCRSELLIEIEGLATPRGRLDMSSFGSVDES
jgi:chorismate lyase/3-hydroxybenzoate synthase